ncbi:MAG: transcriptional regulator [Bacteroidetes bacterium]|jgi:predicted transcriptional regulator YheO|nr:transcriptional regulator [Bacteroidota bacterium]
MDPTAVSEAQSEVSADRVDHILEHYVTIAETLGTMLAPILEVAVHDLRKPGSSIIAIYNGHLTGRNVGDGATDLGLRRLRGDDVPDAMVGYANESPDGTKMKSSSLAIRDDEGALIGALCLNLDISYFEQYGKFVQRLISTHESMHVDDGEDFGATSPAEDIRDAIDQICLSNGWMGRSLSNDQKRTIVEFLYRQGHFKKRGAVTIMAEQLGLTRPSIYNYKNDYVDRRKNRKETVDAENTDSRTD